MEFLFAGGTLLGPALYPVIITLLALYVNRLVMANGRPPVGLYVLCTLGVILAIPLVLVVIIGLISLLWYDGKCSGWMDSGPKACDVGEYLMNSLFWVGLLGLFPTVSGAGIAITLFTWHWFLPPHGFSESSKT